MTRKFTLWLLAIVTCLSACLAVACSGGTSKPSVSPTPSVAPSVSTSIAPSVKPTAKPTVDTTKMTYRVYVYTQGGAPLSGVSVEVRLGDSTVSVERTDSEGCAQFSLLYDTYTVVLSGAPAGYHTEEEYVLNEEELVCYLSSSLISGNAPAGTSYKVGDVMYDFTVTTSDNAAYVLSEELKTHDAVMINFWYSTCYWCLEEFPYMVEAFQTQIEGTEETYADRVSLICVTYNENSDINAFKQTYKNEFDLSSFAMGKDLTLIQQFGIVAYPTSVIVDRYGVISKIEQTAILAVDDFTTLFDRYIGDDYTPSVPGEEEEEDEPVKTPTESMPSSEAIGEVLSPEYSFTYAPEKDDPLSWPFLIGEDEDGKYVYTSNAKVSGSYSILYATVEMKKDEVFAFDYYCETEPDADILYLLVNRQIIEEISGTFEGWQTHYFYTALTDGVYEFAFVYMKDEDTNQGTDRILFRNFRLEEVTEIDAPFYVKRPAVWDFNQTTMTYDSNANVGLNPETGFYHVIREDGSFGPLLMTNFMEGTNWSDVSVYNYSYYYNCFTAEFYDGLDMTDRIEHYASLCNNTAYSLVPVNEELYSMLHHIVRMDLNGSFVVIDKYDETSNEWLELCYYFDAYNTVEMPNPAVGLDNENAYRLVLDDPETEMKETNVAYFDSVLIPRGKRFKFVPEISGVYRATGLSESETLGWLFLPDNTCLVESDFMERIPYDNGMRKNFSFAAYLEAGETYYVSVAFYDLYQMGDLEFYVEYVAPEYELFRFASPGFFTYDPEDPDMTIIAGGISVTLGNDGYYHELKEDGTLGSILYADLTGTGLFNYSLEYMATNTTAFDFRLDENDEQVVDEFGNPVGEDRTTDFRKYLLKAIKEGDVLPDGRVAGAEVVGCVAVDETLAEILYGLTNKYTFYGVEYSWTKLCCYYQYLGPNQTESEPEVPPSETPVSPSEEAAD